MGALAVAKDGRLVLVRGYGTADVEANQPVQPDSLFRIASISKTVTGMAVLRLVEDGRLNLDAKTFALLDLKPAEGATVDPRIAEITVRHLLHHSGGWDRDRSGDPMFSPLSRQAAQVLKAPEPTSCETIIRFMLGRPLDFAPGAEYRYSNFGYCVLGRIIEKVSGQSYEEFVKTNVLGPAGISRMRIGRTLLEGRASGEVRYYHYPDGPLAREPVFPGVAGPVPWPYGGFHLEAMDSHGGWIASPVDLLRLVTGTDGSRTLIFKSRATVSLITARPPYAWAEGQFYYGAGVNVRAEGSTVNWWHFGALPGTATLVVRASNGWAWAAFFNSRAQDQRGFQSELDRALWDAARAVTSWPTHNLFGEYRDAWRPAGCR